MNYYHDLALHEDCNKEQKLTYLTYAKNDYLDCLEDSFTIKDQVYYEMRIDQVDELINNILEEEY